MKQGVVSLDSIEITVLDEADHMADLGFLPGVTRIMNATPKKGQRLLFSATLDNGVDKLVNRFMDSPTTHSVDSADSHVELMTHHVFHVSSADAKKDLVRRLAAGQGRRVLFMRTKHQAKRLAKQLTADGIPSVDLHGNLSQNARDRNLAAFADGSAQVLVATDVAARGVHVDGIELVVHVDPPAEHKAYLHRSGRTARAGTAGDVVTLVLPEQRRDTKDLLRKAKITAQPQDVHATHPVVIDLAGPEAPYVKPAPVQAPQQQRSGGQGGGRGRGRGGAGAGQSRGAQSRNGQSRGGQSTGGRSGQSRGSSQSGQQSSRGQQSGGARRSSGGRTSHASGHSSAAAFSSGGGGSRRRRG